MKTYEKPAITLVSLAANSAFCSCAIDAVEPNKSLIVYRLEKLGVVFSLSDGCGEGSPDEFCKNQNQTMLFDS